MFKSTLFILSVMSISVTTASTPVRCWPAIEAAVPALGGPPSIRIAGKASGDITHAEWGTVDKVQLMGCMPDARITGLTLCIKDCQGRNAGLRSGDGQLTGAMLSMVANLPPGTPFTIKVVVVDGRGRSITVPDATYVWKG
jgi:hypothetical protein